LWFSFVLQIDELMKEADQDGNGQMDYREFLAFVKSL
jgi:Ca2+-binding EF-hand superfamily protein